MASSGTPLSKRVEVAERRRRAIQLRQTGATWQAIADALGYKSKAQACGDVSRALEHITREPAQQLVAEEVSRLDAILSPMFTQAVKGNQGAVDRVLRIMERRAKYLGLDHVTTTELSVADGRVTITFATPAPAGGGPTTPQILELPPVDEPDDDTQP